MTQTVHHPTGPVTTRDDPAAVLAGQRTVLAALAATAGEPSEWQERALCAQTDPELFYPEQGGSTREAKQICQGCEVQAECLEAALGHDERFGIWGGLSERERRGLKPAPTSTNTPAPVAVPDEVEVPEPRAEAMGSRRESAPAPGGGRHPGGTRLATTLPTEPATPAAAR